MNFALQKYEKKGGKNKITEVYSFNYLTNIPIIINWNTYVPIDFPCFPLEINSEKKTSKDFQIFISEDKIDKDFIKKQTISIENDYFNIIKNNFPVLLNSLKNDKYRNDLVLNSKIYKEKNSSCYSINFKTLKVRNHKKSLGITQFWVEGIPWWIYYESLMFRGYLVNYLNK